MGNHVIKSAPIEKVKFLSLVELQSSPDTSDLRIGARCSILKEAHWQIQLKQRITFITYNPSMHFLATPHSNPFTMHSGVGDVVARAHAVHDEGLGFVSHSFTPLDISDPSKLH